MVFASTIGSTRNSYDCEIFVACRTCNDSVGTETSFRDNCAARWTNSSVSLGFENYNGTAFGHEDTIGERCAERGGENRALREHLPLGTVRERFRANDLKPEGISQDSLDFRLVHQSSRLNARPGGIYSPRSKIPSALHGAQERHGRGMWHVVEECRCHPDHVRTDNGRRRRHLDDVGVRDSGLTKRVQMELCTGP
jgi:hypothetical protein